MQTQRPPHAAAAPLRSNTPGQPALRHRIPAWLAPLAYLSFIAGAVIVVGDVSGGVLDVLARHWVALAGGALCIAALAVIWRIGSEERGMRLSSLEEGEGPTPPVEWVGEQLGYYRYEVTKNLVLFTLFKVPAMLAAAALPVIALSGDASLIKWSAGLLGAAIVFFDGIQHLFRYRENWLIAVATRQTLENEVQRYGVHSGPYQDGDRDATLVERTTAIVAEEFSTWMAGLQSHGQQSDSGGQGRGGENQPAARPPTAHD